MLDIGKKIKALRKAKKMSLVELSRTSGVALATLSRIENGVMPGTIESHLNISKSLGVTLSELYKDVDASEKEVVIVSGKKHTETFFHGENVLFEILSTNILSKKMMPVLLKIAPNSKSNSEQAPKDAEKFIYCIEGELELTVAGKIYKIEKADAVYFSADSEHYIANITDKPAKALCVTTPPVL